MGNIKRNILIGATSLMVVATGGTSYWAMHTKSVYEDEVAKKNEAIAVSSNKLNKANTKIIQMESELKDKELAVETLLSDNNSKSKKIMSSSDKLIEKTKELSKLEGSLAKKEKALKTKSSELKVKSEELEIKSGELQVKSDELNATLSSKDKEIAKLQEDFAKEKEKLSQKITDTLSEIKVLEAKVEEEVKKNNLDSSNITHVSPAKMQGIKATSSKLDANPKFRLYSADFPLKAKYKEGDSLLVNATAYTKNCDRCTGITKTGIDIRKKTPNIIAVDPKIVPLNTKVELLSNGTSLGYYYTEDIGSDIKGHRIDILFASKKQADSWGRRNIEMKIINKS